MFCGFFNLFLFILWRVLCAFRTLSRCPTFRIKSPTLLTSISLLLLKVWQTWVGGKSEIASSILWHHHNFQALCSGLLLLPLCPDCLCRRKRQSCSCSLLAVQQCARQGMLPCFPWGGSLRGLLAQAGVMGHGMSGSVWDPDELSPTLWPCWPRGLSVFPVGEQRVGNGQLDATPHTHFLWNPSLHSYRKCYYWFLTRDYSDKRSLHSSVK